MEINRFPYGFFKGTLVLTLRVFSPLLCLIIPLYILMLYSISQSSVF